MHCYVFGGFKSLTTQKSVARRKRIMVIFHLQPVVQTTVISFPRESANEMAGTQDMLYFVQLYICGRMTLREPEVVNETRSSSNLLNVWYYTII